MKHLQFYSFEEFFKHFNLPKRCSIRLTSEETAYFEFYPYKDEVIIIRGWIREFNHKEVQISFKYREFSLGTEVWSHERAKQFIRKIDYYYPEDYD